MRKFLLAGASPGSKKGKHIFSDGTHLLRKRRTNNVDIETADRNEDEKTARWRATHLRYTGLFPILCRIFLMTLRIP